MFGRLRIDKNDTLYSAIIRFGVKRCRRCGMRAKLQAAHIVGRAHYSTRFLLNPIRNAIPLCMTCHAWFDSHKIEALIFDDTGTKRVFTGDEEGYTFLVKKCGYSWRDLQRLYILSRQIFKHYTHKKHIITAELTEYLERLKSAAEKE